MTVTFDILDISRNTLPRIRVARVKTLPIIKTNPNTVTGISNVASYIKFSTNQINRNTHIYPYNHEPKTVFITHIEKQYFSQTTTLYITHDLLTFSYIQTYIVLNK